MRNSAISILIVITLSNCAKEVERRYYESGRPKSTAEVKDGVYHGEFVTYYESGEVKSKGNWNNGIGNGFIERFYENGNTEEKAFFKSGYFDGSIQVFYPNGTKRLNATYSEGRKIGEYSIFDRSGRLLEKHLYSDEGIMYYLVRFENDQNALELFFPLIELDTEKKLVRVKSIINFDGSALIDFGYKSHDLFSAIVTKTQFKNAAIDIQLPEDVDIENLFYRIEFTPSHKDSLGLFVLDKKAISQVHKEPESRIGDLN